MILSKDIDVYMDMILERPIFPIPIYQALKYFPENLYRFQNKIYLYSITYYGISYAIIIRRGKYFHIKIG